MMLFLEIHFILIFDELDRPKSFVETWGCHHHSPLVIKFLVFRHGEDGEKLSSPFSPSWRYRRDLQVSGSRDEDSASGATQKQGKVIRIVPLEQLY